ncbi:MAG: hypothetical protein HYY20_07295 [Candidatus Tectomicrobia bacterium]|uniref:Uncharacterized protein n=1 Tax=Tectimicrobiota bacterium TaxID=2528274 RepID=A0A932G0U1_UNCTE|nr:hypothetical protein [Candidatus Tectomicrobia bacterium]
MEEKAAKAPLKKFFEPLTARAFTELGIRDARIVDYVSDVLSRFARMDSLYRIRNAQGKPLDTVVEMLMAAEQCLELESLNPSREKDIHQHIGDFTLFMAGIFREYVERQGILGLYIHEGEASYRSVAEYLKLLFKPEATLFYQLSRGFEQYAGSLNYLKKVYLRPESHGGAYREILTGLGD